MILLTGVTGKTGSAAASILIGKGEKLRAIVRDESKATALRDAGVDLVVGDLNDQDVLDRAMQGVTKALMITPNGEQQLDLEKNFVDTAKAAGVKHVVKLSSMEACPEATAPIPRVHDDSEKYLEASGLTWTMVRPNFFMQNFFGNAATIKSDQFFALPMGDGKAGMSDTRDIGAVLAEVLTGEGHENKSYNVTGPELLSFADAAARFSDALGKEIRYVDQDIDEYRAHLGKFIASEWHVNAVCTLFDEIREGGLEMKTDTVKELLGREPVSLGQFVKDHIHVFQD